MVALLVVEGGSNIPLRNVSWFPNRRVYLLGKNFNWRRRGVTAAMFSDLSLPIASEQIWRVCLHWKDFNQRKCSVMAAMFKWSILADWLGTNVLLLLYIREPPWHCVEVYRLVKALIILSFISAMSSCDFIFDTNIFSATWKFIHLIQSPHVACANGHIIFIRRLYS